MRKILSIILAISILCTMSVAPVVAEETTGDDVVLEEVTPDAGEDGEVTPEVTPDAGGENGEEPTDPEGSEGEGEVTPDEPVVEKTEYYVHHTLPSLLNADPSHYAGDLIATNQETIKVVFSENVGEDYDQITFTDADGNEPIGGVLKSKDGKTVTLKFGELKVDTEYKVTVPETMVSVEGHASTPEVIKFKTLNRKHLGNVDFSTFEDGTYAQSDLTKNGLKITGTGSGNATLEIVDGVLRLTKTKAKTDSYIGSAYGTRELEYQYVKENEDGSTEIATGRRDFNNLLSSAKVFTFIKTATGATGTYTESGTEKTDYGENFMLGGIRKSIGFSTAGYNVAGVYDAYHLIKAEDFVKGSDGFLDLMIVSSMQETEMADDLSTTTVKLNGTAYDLNSSQTYSMKEVTNTLNTGVNVETGSTAALKAYSKATGVSTNIKSIRQGFYLIPAPLSEANWDNDTKTLSYVMNTDIDVENSKFAFGGYNVVPEYNPETRVLSLTVAEDIMFAGDYTFKFTDLVSVDGIKGRADDDIITVEGNSTAETFGIVSTIPTRLVNSNIAVNQGVIKVTFAEEVSEGLDKITFTDSTGKAPVGGIFVTKEGTTVTIKFGELPTSTKYTLRLPTDLRSVNEKVFEGKSLTFNTIGQKVLADEDFSDTEKWPAGMTFPLADGETAFTTVNPKASAYLRNFAYGTAAAGDSTLSITENGTLRLANGSTNSKDRSIGSTHTAIGNSDVISIIKFKTNAWTATGSGLANIYYNLKTTISGNGYPVANLKDFSKDGDFYDVTFRSIKEEVSVAEDGTTLNHTYSLSAKDNISGAEANTQVPKTSPVAATGNNRVTARIGIVKSYAANNDIEIASVRQGFFTIPAPLASSWDEEAKTLTYVMNTDIDVNASKIALGDYATEVSYDEATRELKLTVTEDVVISGDYTVDFTNVVSVDGFKGELTTTATVTGADVETFAYSYTLPSRINTTYGKNIPVNLGEIKVVFPEAISEGLDKITFTDANGNTPKGGIFVSLDETRTIVTVKFGELNTSTVYNLRLPTSIKSESGKTYEGKTVDFKTIGQKVLLKEDFSNTAKWVPGTSYAVPTKENYFNNGTAATVGYFRYYAKNSGETLNITNNGTLQNVSTTAGNIFFGSNFTATHNAKIVSRLRFKINSGYTASGSALAFLAYKTTTNHTGELLKANKNLEKFSKDSDDFYNVTVYANRIESAVSGNTVTYTDTFTALDDDSTAKIQNTKSTNTSDATTEAGLATRFWVMKSLAKGNDVEFASIDNGFYTIPAPLADYVLDEETKTITFVMNTDIDLENSGELKLVSDVFGELPVVATFDAETRNLVITYEGDLRDGYDYSLNLSALVSSDGFEVEKDVVINNGEVKPNLIELVQTFPTRTYNKNGNEYGKNIGVNQEEIKLIFDEEIMEGYNDITFTDAEGNAPKGGLFIEKDGATVTLKFGELNPSTTYTLTLPQTLVSVSGKICEGQELVFNTTLKVLINEDFTDTAKWTPETEFALTANEAYFYSVAPQAEETSPRFRIYYNGAGERAGTTLKITPDNTLGLTINADGGNRIITSNPSAMSDIKVVTDMKFKASFVKTAGTGFGSMWSGFTNALAGNGMEISAIKDFSKNNDFYDVTFVSERKETAFDGTTITFENSISAKDNISGKAATPYTDGVTSAEVNDAASVVNRVVAVKAYNVGDVVEIASLRQGHYSIPAPIKSDIDLENKTLTFNMNTDIASYDELKLTSDVGEMPITVVYDEPTRTLTVTYEEDLRNGYDYTLNLKDLVSVDGFKGDENVVFNNGEEKEEEATLLYTLPSRLNGTNSSFIGPNQEEITLVFSEEIVEGYENITLTDPEGNAPKGGVVVAADGNKATLKFGELETGKIYTVTVPASVLTASGKYVSKTSVKFETMAKKELINETFADKTAVPESISSRIKGGTMTVENGLLTIANTATSDSTAGADLVKKMSTAKVVSDIKFKAVTNGVSSQNGNGLQLGGFWKASFMQASYNFKGARFADMVEEGFTTDETGFYDLTVVSALTESEMDFDAKTTVLKGKTVAYDNVSNKSVVENYTSEKLQNGAAVETDSYAFATVYHKDESLSINAVRTGFFTIPKVLKAVQDKEANTITLTMNTDIVSGYDNIKVGNLPVTNAEYNDATRELVLTYDGVIKDGYDYTITIADVVSADGFKAYENYKFNNGLEKAEEFKLLYTLPSVLNASDKQYIGVNQEEITLVFDEEPGELYKDITFTDANGNAPVGGVIITKDGNKVTLKFGELALNTTYTVRLPELLTSVSGKYVTAATVKFITMDVKELINADFTDLTTLPSSISTKLEDGNAITLEGGMLNLTNTVKADTKVGSIFDRSISSAKIVSNIKYAEPTINETDKGANLTFGGIWKSKLAASGYNQKGISVSDINKVGFTKNEDGLYDITVKSELTETALNLETNYTTLSTTATAYDNISAKVAAKKAGTAELPIGTAVETNSYTFADVFNKDEAVSIAYAKVGFYVMPAPLTKAYDAANLTYTYVMNTDINAETIANITVNGEAATATYDAATRTIVVSNVPAEDSVVNFFNVYSADGFEVEISDKTPEEPEEPVTFALANNAVTVADGVANFSFDYTNDVEKTVQVVIAEYHGDVLAKVEVKDVTLGVTTNEAITYTTEEGFALVDSEAANLKVMATIWDYATLKALCASVNN